MLVFQVTQEGSILGFNSNTISNQNTNEQLN